MRRRRRALPTKAKSGPSAAQKAAWAQANPAKASQGWYLDAGGYVARMERVDGRRKYVREHRVVAAAMLGRALKRGENVHHLNGDRTDNRESNIQVWSTQQPAGQRIEDKLAWAYELIELYDPEGLLRPGHF